MVKLYQDMFGEILLLLFLGWSLISIPIVLNISLVSLDVIGTEWDFETFIYGTSMEPTFTDGDSVVIERIDAAEVKATPEGGDIIAFTRPNRSILIFPSVVIHRAINKTYRSDLDLYYFQTMGDHNSEPDDWVDTQGEEYTWNGMISQNLLKGKIVGVKKQIVLERPVIIMAAILASLIVIDYVGYANLTQKKVERAHQKTKDKKDR